METTTQERKMTPTELERLQEREQSLRMTIAKLVDAIERYPSDLYDARMRGVAELEREPLWYELENTEVER